MPCRTAARGWETLTRRVGAFSSLGYFTDPLYSYMADDHAERLASMILHEMTHETVWFANDAPLNEAIATFIGHAGAIDDLEHRFGTESDVYVEAVRRQTERETFTVFMRDLARRLEDLYASGAPASDVAVVTSSISSLPPSRCRPIPTRDGRSRERCCNASGVVVHNNGRE